MPFKQARPEVRAGAARSASSAAASAFYDEGQSAHYTTQANAAIQRDLTRHALELLRCSVTASSSLTAVAANDEPWLLLDLGAGSGLSTLAANEWLLERGLLGFTMAFDISASMLSLTAASSASAAAVETKGSSCIPTTINTSSPTHAQCVQRTGFYRGNAAQRFPLRAGVFHAAIGISMLQWLTQSGLETCFASLHAQLARSSSSTGTPQCAVFQVYPQSLENVELMEQSARAMGFARAEVFVSFPHATTAKKWFLRVDGASQRSTDDDSSAPCATADATPICLFGRRFHRRCAWHVLTESDSSSSAVAALRERLGREHVKTAWHIWRKFRRALTSADAPPLHAKAKRSLALWTSDEVIGAALQRLFLPPADGAASDERVHAVTYDLFLSRMDDVVETLHTVRPLCLSCAVSVLL